VTLDDELTMNCFTPSLHVSYNTECLLMRIFAV